MERTTANRVGRPRGGNVENTKRRRKQLIDAAVNSIVENGLSATTLATVSKASGLSQGTAVFYFKNKESLLNATFRFRLDEYRTAWLNALAAAGPDPVDRLSALVFASLDPLLATPQNLTFWHAFWPEAARNPTLNDLSESYDAERQAVQMSLCEEAAPNIAVEAWTPKLLAHTLESITDGYYSVLHYSPEFMSLEEARQSAATLMATIFPSHAKRINKCAGKPINDIQEA